MDKFEVRKLMEKYSLISRDESKKILRDIKFQYAK